MAHITEHRALPQPGRTPGELSAWVCPRRPASVPEARRRTRALLLRHGADAELCADAVLLMSELVTNAVLRADGSLITCRTRVADCIVRMEVCDEGTGTRDTHGLFLVERIAAGWGVAPSVGGGRTVWATLPLDPLDRAAALRDADGLPAGRRDG